MSHYIQEALLITASPDLITELIPWVEALGLVHSGSMPMIQDTACLCIAPSGSKYGWAEYYHHLEQMRHLKEFIDQRNKSHEGRFDYAHVAFGENVNGEPMGQVIEIQKETGNEEL